ncbi:MAG TPA: TonB family protein [Alphaproteobacteria bacterium]
MNQASNSIAREMAEPRRRPWLAATLALSLAAHIGLAATLGVEQKPQPDVGAIVDIEIVADAGAARPGAANAAVGGPSRAAQEPAKPETAPTPKAVQAPNAPRASHVPTPNAPALPSRAPPKPPLPERAKAAPAAPTVLQRPEHVPPVRSPPAADVPKPAAPEIVALRPAVPVALRRPARIPPPPAKTPRLAAPSNSGRAADSSGPARPQTASVPIVAADAAPGSGPDTGTTPPRYGFGSAANPIPRYPETARARGWEGLVLLSVRVAANGQAASVSISQSSGHGLLDDAAVDAVRRWRFEAARRAGVPIAGTATVPIRFRLED